MTANASTPNKIALITGAGKGLGRESARQLASQGVHVILTARTLENARTSATQAKIPETMVTPMALEISDPTSVAHAVRTVTEQFGRLDILLNNAAILLESLREENAVSSLSLKTLRDTFEINFFAQFSVTQAFLPLLKKSQGARIVNVSSLLGSLESNSSGTFGGMGPFAYSSSKTALNALTVHLAQELKGTPHKVNSASPGWVKTDMGTQAATLEVQDGAKTLVDLSLIGAEGPSGGFFHLGETLPW